MTILWWGSEIFTLRPDGTTGRHTIPLRNDGVNIFTSVLDSLAEKPKRLRLIYQPSDLEIHPVQAPRGSRNVIKRSLGHEFSQILNPATVWSCQRLRAHSDGYSTLLYIESRPRMARLQSAVADRNIFLEGAWPLVTLLEQVPPTSDQERPAIAVAHTDERGVVFTMDHTGDRKLEQEEGADFHARCVHHLQAAFSLFDANQPPPVLVVGDAAQWPLPELMNGTVPTVIALPDLLAAAEKIPAGDISNLGLREFTINANLCGQVLGGLSLAGAAALAFFYYQDVQRYSHDLGKIDEARATISADIARLRANRTIIETSEAFTREVTEDAGAKLTLFHQLVTATPAPVEIRALRITQKSFTIEGTAREGLGQNTGPFFTFFEAISSPSQPWTISKDNRPEKLTSPDFTLNGTFK